MKKILITAFEKFGNHTENPSEILLSEIKIPENTKCLLLPVTFKNSFEKMNSLLLNNRFNTVIMLGLANDRENISYEQIAINLIDCTIPDNNNEFYRNQKIFSNGPDGIFTNFSADTLFKIEQYPKAIIKKSLTAGSFVCNYVYYQTRIQYPEINSIFIHLPNFDKVKKEIQKDFIEYILSIV